MNLQVRKFISTALSVVTAFSLSAAGLGTAFAAQPKEMTSISAVPSDVTAGAPSVNYTIVFKTKSTALIQSFSVAFATTPSGTATAPATFSNAGIQMTHWYSGASFTNGVVSGGTDEMTPAAFQTTIPGTGGNGSLTPSTAVFKASTGYTPGAADETQAVTLTGLQNNDLTSNCDGIADSSDTCYIRLATYTTTDGSGTATDVGVTTYTVMTPITANATVDPTLTFQVFGVNGFSSAGIIDTNDANASASGTTTVDTTPVGIPFGNVKVGVVKTAQQRFSVATNANNGYTVYAKFTGTAYGGTSSGSYLMAGTQGTNKLDPFVDGTWTSPIAFTNPTSTTANTNTGWVGMRTNSTGSAGLSGFGTSNTYSTPFVGAGVGNPVVIKTGPDDGISKTAVTYKISVDAYQPADLYTGTVVYNVIASY